MPSKARAGSGRCRDSAEFRHTDGVPLEQSRIVLRSPFARAVVPVLGGIGLLIAVALLTWIAAAIISDNSGRVTDNLAPDRFTVSSSKSAAEQVAENGPILFPGLNTTTGERTIVLDHDGDDADTGWHVYYAYPADRDASCAIDQEEGGRTFVDCEGRTLDVEDLALPPAGVFPTVEDGTLIIDLRGAN